MSLFRVCVLTLGDCCHTMGMQLILYTKYIFFIPVQWIYILEGTNMSNLVTLNDAPFVFVIDGIWILPYSLFVCNTMLSFWAINPVVFSCFFSVFLFLQCDTPIFIVTGCKIFIKSIKKFVQNFCIKMHTWKHTLPRLLCILNTRAKILFRLRNTCNRQ